LFFFRNEILTLVADWFHTKCKWMMWRHKKVTKISPPVGRRKACNIYKAPYISCRGFLVEWHRHRFVRCVLLILFVGSLVEW
jgi:hypothetical protein